MDIQSRTVELGVVEQQFILKTPEDTVPGILWSPEPPTGPLPTVLIGHGGGEHRRTPYVLNLARRFVRNLGFCAVALEAPDHGASLTPKRTSVSGERSKSAGPPGLASGLGRPRRRRPGPSGPVRQCSSGRRFSMTWTPRAKRAAALGSPLSPGSAPTGRSPGTSPRSP